MILILAENETSESCVMARDAVGSATARAELPSQRAHILAPRVALLPASPAKWLAEKNQRDQAVFGVPAHLWQVHGQLYDLTAYLSRHPGGREWLEMTRGSDVTVFFETHHLNQAKACAVLQQYRVDRSTPPPATSSDASADAYEWQPDGFYCTLRDRVRATLQQNGTSEAPTAVMLAYCYTFVALWFLGLFGTLFWCSWALSVVTGLLTLPVMGIGHNFMHKRNHILRYTFDLTCFGHHQWRISHVLSHHSYPNLYPDIEASQVEPYATFFRSQPSQTMLSAIIVVPVFFCMIPVMEMVRLVMYGLTREEPWRPEVLIKVAQLAIFYAVQGGVGLAQLWLIHTIGVWLLFITSLIVHRSEFGWTEGCQPLVAEERDFGRHTILATQDYAVNDLGLLGKLVLAGSFNDHICHHLFPTLDLSKQSLVRPVIVETMREFKVPYEERSFGELFWRTATTLVRSPDEGLKYRPPRTS